MKTKADDELAKTEEQIALNVQKADAGAISTLRVTQAVQKRQAVDAAVKQASAAIDQSQAGVHQAEATVAAAQSAEQWLAADASLCLR